MTASELVASSKMLASTEPEEAVSKALEAVSLCKKAKDKKGESEALDAGVAAYMALPDVYEAIMLAKASLRAKKALADTAGEGAITLQLAEMQFTMKNNTEALKYAENAMACFTSLKDHSGKANCNELMSSIYCALGEPSKAPNRAEALRMLDQMKRAIANNDSARFHKTMDALKTMGAVTQEDIDNSLGEQLSGNYMPTAKFLKDNLDMDELVPKTNGICVPKRIHYFGFRSVGGLGYGPAFRFTNSVTCKPTHGDPFAMWGATCLEVADDRESWEHEVAYNHGILDGLIQQGMSNSMVTPNGTPAWGWMNQFKDGKFVG